MIIISLVFVAFIFFLTLSNTIYGGDAGDLISAILTKGQAHPPGYSLYSLLGIFLNNLPIANLTPAGKVTLLSTISTILGLLVFTLIIREITKLNSYGKFALIITLFVLGFNYIVWLYAVVPEVFPLNTLIILTIFYSAVKLYKSKSLKYIYLISFLIGLGISHHHTFLLVIPSIAYLYLKIKNQLRFSIKSIAFSIGSFLLGSVPLAYLVYASVFQAEIQWGEANTVDGFIGLLTRRVYGTFVPGGFISNIPYHRFLQLKVLFLFTGSDFTLLGLVLITLGFFYYLRLGKGTTKTLLTSVLINILLFGPFYFFYANYPLNIKFEFATVERFIHAFYFFLGFFIYFGLWQIFIFIDNYVIQKIIRSDGIKRIALVLLPLIFFIYPLLLLKNNSRFITLLKNDKTAENLAEDTLRNAKKNSIILLTQDTILFDTQYFYYAFPKKRNDNIVIHLYKFNLSFYPKLLKKYYPKLQIVNLRGETFPLSEFILKNIHLFNIYANDAPQLVNLPDYEWVPQGLLFKLVKKQTRKTNELINDLNEFWKHSKNKNLATEVQQNSYKFKNLLLSDILNFYSVAHMNSAALLLDNGHADDAFNHITVSHILDPDDSDYYLLMSKYDEVKLQCKKAEQLLDIGFSKSNSLPYLTELSNLAANCFSEESDKKRIEIKLKKYLEKLKTPINKY